jgi:lysine N6-hydroxylase
MPEHTASVDVLGIGVGPFNLSTAALLTKAPELKAKFVDRRPGFEWHPGLLFKNASLQSPFLKDCVTLVDPTSPFTFLNYLVRMRRLNRFIIADYANVSRREYNAYFQWMCDNLPTVEFGVDVARLKLDDSAFAVSTSKGDYLAKDVVLGVGRPPSVPATARRHLGDTVFHASEYLSRRVSRAGLRVVVIGGGQSGAEIFHDLIQDDEHLPLEVTWITRRSNFSPFDESPFANELYVPGYTKFFYAQSAAERERLLPLQKLSSDAILQPLLESIYRRLYELDYLENRKLAYRLVVDRELADLAKLTNGWQLGVRGPNGLETLKADVVILATGFEWSLPEVLRELSGRLELDGHGRCAVNADFSLRWDGPEANRIFVHNLALHTHGWADPNFAGMAWRSGTIVNGLARRTVYDVDIDATTVDWWGKTLTRRRETARGDVVLGANDVESVMP